MILLLAAAIATTSLTASVPKPECDCMPFCDSKNDAQCQKPCLAGEFKYASSSCPNCPVCNAKPNPKSCICTKDYTPVCGADGVTQYGNSCMAKCASETNYTEGKCAPEAPEAQSKCKLNTPDYVRYYEGPCGEKFEMERCTCTPAEYALFKSDDKTTPTWQCTVVRRARMPLPKEECMKCSFDKGDRKCGDECEEPCPVGVYCEKSGPKYCQKNGKCGVESKPECTDKGDETTGTPICCNAMTASCMSCAAGLTVAEYCAKKPTTYGCKPDTDTNTNTNTDKPVCTVGKKIKKDCNTCTCGEDKTWSCTENVCQTTPICCNAMTASCMSCAVGLTVAEYCAKNPTTYGCKKPCLSYSCMAPPENCKYGKPSVDKNGCKNGCGLLTCKCPKGEEFNEFELGCVPVTCQKFKCEQPLENCTYGKPEVDENGCEIGCGPLQCPVNDPCITAGQNRSAWREMCGPDPWKTICPSGSIAKENTSWAAVTAVPKTCCFNADTDCKQIDVYVKPITPITITVKPKKCCANKKKAKCMACEKDMTEYEYCTKVAEDKNFKGCGRAIKMYKIKTTVCEDSEDWRFTRGKKEYPCSWTQKGKSEKNRKGRCNKRDASKKRARDACPISCKDFIKPKNLKCTMPVE